MNLSMFFLRKQPKPAPVRYIVATKSESDAITAKRAKVNAELRAYVQSKGRG